MAPQLERGRLHDYIDTAANPQKQMGVDSHSQTDGIIEQIPESEIVNTVMSIVSEAHTEVKMSMLLSQEKDAPLSPTYHNLIKQKVAEGIKITRIGFGSEEDFKFMEDKLEIQGESYFFVRYPDVDTYRRFIMVDGEVLFFKFEDTFYRTRDASEIQRYKAYFDRLISKI